ncbi:MAG: glutaminyl-peptide cyclotransferase [Acidobacteria bacterium]|nr:glutaminyl-peptide cyclotransferase [Acidobacteriota bacterium]
MRLYIFLCIAVLLAGCDKGPAKNGNMSVNTGKTNTSNTNAPVRPGPVPVYTYEVVNTYKHDPTAFTEGLYFKDGFLYESTGEEGKSQLRKVELESGKVLQKFDLPRDSFGEGISPVGDKIYQLTWQEEVCRVFDAKDFKLLKEFKYQGEGWGMTTDGTNLYMTNRTHVINVRDPETFQPVRQISVFREDGRPLMQINELEWIKGEIWANVWHSEEPSVLGKPNYIARIDPRDGKLLGWVDLAGISPDDDVSPTDDKRAENTLNGIAYDEATDRIFVTGKNWKKLFEIKVKPKQ